MVRMLIALALGAALASTAVAGAAAGEPTFVDVVPRRGYVRLVLVTPEKVGYEANLVRGELRVAFDRKLAGDFTAPVADAPDYIRAARHSDDTDRLTFALAENVRLATAQAENVIAIDLFSPAYKRAVRSLVTERDMTLYLTAAFFADKTPSLNPRLASPAEAAPQAEQEAAPAMLASMQVVSPPSVMSEPAVDTASDQAGYNPNKAFEIYRALARKDGFAAAEEMLLSKLASGTASIADARAVAYFYMAHKLYPEALAVLNEHNPDRRDAELTLLEGVASYEMGRWDDAVDILNEDVLRGIAAAAPWRGLANVRRGAYKRAADDLLGAPPALVPYEENAADYDLGRADAALHAGDFGVARAALEDARRGLLNDRQRAEHGLIEAQMLYAQGREDAARGVYERLAQSAPPPISTLAALYRLKDDFAQGKVDASAALDALEALQLTWKGGAFERRALSFRGDLMQEKGDIAGAFRARRLLADTYPYADVSAEALKEITANLPNLFARADLEPLDAAEIFYENIDLAPPGEAGDALIHHIAEDLTELDLLDEAAELMRHQVFNRLRGGQRSAEAAELAALYLSDHRPEDALFVLRSTRLARLPEALNEKRRTLEAKALIETGSSEAALNLLADDDSAQSSILRGDIHWADKKWSLAGEAYAKALDASQGALNAAETRMALKTVSAFALAGDDDASKAFAARVKDRIDDGAARALLEDLGASAFADGASFLSAYEKYFGAGVDS